jgi:hypothetical protein
MNQVKVYRLSNIANLGMGGDKYVIIYPMHRMWVLVNEP